MHEEEEEHLFMASHVEESSKSQSWLMDSGCTSHMTNDPSFFTNLDTSVNPKVKLPNGYFARAKGRGTIAVNTKQGTKYISNVLYVPELVQNMLSVTQMMKYGYGVNFKNFHCLITDEFDSEIATLDMVNDSFYLNLDDANARVFCAIKDDSEKWHKRFGHFNYRTLKLMYTTKLVKDMPAISEADSKCECCELGKSHRLPFSKSGVIRATHKLEIVHSDICGPMSIPSWNGNKYFVLFIDDYTRMCWVYFLSSKASVFSIFKRFKKLVEVQSGSTLRILRTDNGGEYTSNEFEEFLQQHGVIHQVTVPYSPQQNGVSERKNRTVMEMARSIIFEKKLPKTFWAEAVATSVYLLNRLATKAVSDKTPIEAWSGNKPSVQHLKIFGCICYYHVPEVKRSKLDEKARKGVFVGYATESKGYRIFDLHDSKIAISRDVTFDEEAYWDWNEKEVKRHVDENSGTQDDTHYDVTNEPEFNVQDTTDTDVLRTRPLADLYESCNFVIVEPESYMDASKHDVWIDAMKSELEMIKKNNTWKLVDLPEGKNAIGVKWVYRTKFHPDGSIHKHKARLVVKGYSQVAGIDFGDTFAPVARHDTIKLLLSIAAQRNWKIHHLDVKSAFLNGELEEEIYVRQPQGFEVAGEEERVYRLYKALYGLKQAPRAWYAKIDAHLLNHNFRRSSSESTLYIKQFNSQEKLIISLYVDDLLVIGSNDEIVKEFKKQMECEFDMSDLGLVYYFLGMEIKQESSGVYISQKKYASDMLKRFNMFSCKSVASPLVLNCKLSKDDGEKLVDPTPYRSIVGSLLYLTITRPDLAYSASFLSRFMNAPSTSHVGAAKRVLRYLKGSINFGIMFERNKDVKLEGYADSDWAGSIDDMKSTSGYVFSLGSGIFCWNSKKQSVVAQSTAEAEYIALSAAVNHAIWLRKLLSDLDLIQEGPTIIYCDNKSAIAIAENPVQHGRTKHINVKYHAIREAEKNGEVKLKYCTSETQIADMLTKSLTGMKLNQLKARLMMS